MSLLFLEVPLPYFTYGERGSKGRNELPKVTIVNES